jgi:hypothetical protein
MYPKQIFRILGLVKVTLLVLAILAVFAGIQVGLVLGLRVSDSLEILINILR